MGDEVSWFEIKDFSPFIDISMKEGRRIFVWAKSKDFNKRDQK